MNTTNERIGDKLLAAGLICDEDLVAAVHVQQRCGGRLGPLLVALGSVSQASIDRIWRESHVDPHLSARIGRVMSECGMDGITPEFEFAKIYRRDTIVENMMKGSMVERTEVEIDGLATMTLGEFTSPQFVFEINAKTNECEIPAGDEQKVRAWLKGLDRSRVNSKAA
ncbi:MAG: hypothetical protein IPK69_03725 [Phycisphaerales bacterium]|nr:MAG: hypothetical protein IPK69_03725 [Phycisphaerales bacterium]